MTWTKVPNDEVLKKHPNLKDFLPFLDVHNAESPRGAVLVACAFLDDQLRSVIDAFLVDGSDRALLLDGFNAPIGTFSARIKTAHGLGLIHDLERDDLEMLRKIRNEFAHGHKATFDDQKIAVLSGKLHFSAKSYGDVAVSPFGAFSSAAIGLALNLVNRSHYVAQKRLVFPGWPL